MNITHRLLTWILVLCCPSYTRHIRQQIRDAYLKGREVGEMLGAARGYSLARHHHRRIYQSKFKWLPSNEDDVP